MNIAVCVNSLSQGGSEVFATEIALEYAHMGHSVCFVIYMLLDKKGEYLQKILTDSGIEVINLDLNKKIELVSIPYKLAKIFKKRSIEVVHSNLEQMDLYVALSSFFYKTKRIRTLHSMNAYMRLPYVLHKWLFKKYDASIGCSEQLTQNYSLAQLRKYIIPINNGIPVHNFSESEKLERRTSLRRRLGIPDKTPVFLQIGRFKPIFGVLCKGHDFTLEAVSQLKNEDFRIIFIGDDADRLNPELYNQTLEDDSRLIFEGIVTNPTDYILASDILLSPSRVEGLPISALEGSFLGLPILSSDIDAFNLFLESSTLKFCLSGSVRLSVCMSEILKNLDKYKAAAKENMNYYHTRFSISQTASKYLALINEIDGH